MLTQDRTAFVERIEVRQGDKRADKRRLRVEAARVQALQIEFEARMAATVVRNMERDRGLDEDASAELRVRPTRERGQEITARDLESARALLRRKEKKLAARRARLQRLEKEAEEREGSTRTFRMFRLHSASHQVECSERRFIQWSTAQPTMPVWVTSESGRRWWWFSDRFWWDDEGLSANEVKSLVVGLNQEENEQRDAVMQVRAEVFGRKRRDSSP